MSVRPTGLALAISILAAPLQAGEDPSDLCLTAAMNAAKATGVPYEVLLSIALVETGRDSRPWPWTVNHAGEGKWFDTRNGAEEWAQSILDRGETSLDVGCFQLNIRWHSKGFTSLTDMLDPERNAAYAAEFLAAKHAETGNWSAAAAAYHSQTPEHAEAYRAKFDAVYAALDPLQPDPMIDTERLNGFPLLLAGRSGANGSLVPMSGGGGPLIGGY